MIGEELYPRVKNKPKTCKIKEMEQQLKNERNRCKDKKYNRNCTKEKKGDEHSNAKKR